MGLKLYGMPTSTSTARALFCLHEKEVDYEQVPIIIPNGEQKHPSFMAKNPFGKVPVLEDDDFTLFESRAITTYLCEKYKNQGTDLLRQGNPKEAALVKQWMEVEAHHYNAAIQPIIYQVIVYPKKGKPTDPALLEAGIETYSKLLDIYEARLSVSKYLGGDSYTLADLHVLPYTIYLMKTEYARLINERPHVSAWWKNITSRPATMAVAKNMTYGENLDFKNKRWKLP
ncbi:hypothetical protein V2J09_016002 [Rumex salicifolius]